MLGFIQNLAVSYWNWHYMQFKFLLTSTNDNYLIENINNHNQKHSKHTSPVLVNSCVQFYLSSHLTAILLFLFFFALFYSSSTNSQWYISCPSSPKDHNKLFKFPSQKYINVSLHSCNCRGCACHSWGYATYCCCFCLLLSQICDF